LGGIYLASQGKDGWGWCFFFAAFCHVTPGNKAEPHP